MTSIELQLEEAKSNLVDMTQLKNFYKNEFLNSELEKKELLEKIESLTWIIDAKQGQINNLKKSGEQNERKSS